MKDPLTEGLKEAGEVLKKVYTDFMKIYEREDKSEDKPKKSRGQQRRKLVSNTTYADCCRL